MTLACKTEIESIVRAFVEQDELLNRAYLLLLHLSNRCNKAASEVFERDVDPIELNKDNSAFMYELSYTLKFVSESFEAQGDAHGIDIDKVKKGLGIK